MKKILLVVALLFAPGLAFADTYVEGEDTGTGPTRPELIGGYDGVAVWPIPADPITKRLEVEIERGAFFYGAGIVNDSTSNSIGGGGDKDGAPWTTANFFPMKTVLLHVNDSGGTSGSIVFRPEGSFTGIEADYHMIFFTKMHQGNEFAVKDSVDTLQFVFDPDGSPIENGAVFIDFSAVYDPIDGFIKDFNAVLRPFPYLRMRVLNRTQDTEIFTSHTWGGSQ